MCANEKPFRHTAEQNIHVARHLYTSSRNKIIDLPYDLICRTTSLRCFRHKILAYNKLLQNCQNYDLLLFKHGCDVKTMNYHVLNTAGKWCLSYVHCEGILQ